VRPAVADRLVSLLNEGPLPAVHLLGSPGQGDLSATADIAVAVFDGFDPAAGAFAANAASLDTAVADARPYPGLRFALGRLCGLLEGSFLHEAGVARNLQDPLTFRNLPQQQGAARDAIDHVAAQLAIELNAAQNNPIVVTEDGRIISAAEFEVLPLATALDYARIALAPLLASAAERTVKLLDRPWSGLSTGLAHSTAGGTVESGLAHYAISAQAVAGEARLLAQPVSFELVSTSGAEGIEDRVTMAPLAARRLADMVGLGEHVLAIELLVAAQAVELRGSWPLGRGTARLLALTREVVPFMAEGDPLPPDLEPLRALVASGALSEL
jgi:histidine ammonia-lyase